MADSPTQAGKRKKKTKKFYGVGKKGKYQNVIKPGMRGVLVFGADNEAKAKKEAYNLLNEYADELFGCEFSEEVKSDTRKEGKPKTMVINYQQGDGNKTVEHEDIDSGSENDNANDIEKVIAKEIEQISSLKANRRFQHIPTGVRAILFIKTTLSCEDLNRLMHRILCDIAKTKQSKVSFQRLVPITHICQAELKSISKIVDEHYLEKDTEGSVKSICVHFKSRFNSNLKRNDVLSEVSSLFLNLGDKVDLKNPDFVIVLEIMKNLCFMNKLTDFYHHKRYNLHQIGKSTKHEGVEKDDNFDERKNDDDDSEVNRDAIYVNPICEAK
ncbi:THUMP domain-containing protein 1-like isoform X2 [Xenia sp. Carnegie-2017]|uniref:THUMP domain-containing protein 1-like isoform X2 n=1 Tax=Xenia sp. Carnegie-2017 TaxID=2897299 RepID=UPI001F04191E|nr:THUMP domain-containing protein 1-like isoform X2 [Xenia sp. Carnegie-2017]